jgi:hypothetical protein
MTEVSVSDETAGFWAGIPRNDGDALARNRNLKRGCEFANEI